MDCKDLKIGDWVVITGEDTFIGRIISGGTDAPLDGNYWRIDMRPRSTTYLLVPKGSSSMRLATRLEIAIHE